MGSRSVLVLLAVVALACGGKASIESSDGGHQGSSGGAGSGSGGGSGDGSGGGSGDGSGGDPGDDGSALLDAEPNADAPSVGVDAMAPITCTPPTIYGGSSGSGQYATGWEEQCGNGHLYMAYCQTPYCECDCTDDGPDGGVVQTHVPTCGGNGFAACGFPTQ